MDNSQDRGMPLRVALREFCRDKVTRELFDQAIRDGYLLGVAWKAADRFVSAEGPLQVTGSEDVQLLKIRIIRTYQMLWRSLRKRLTADELVASGWRTDTAELQTIGKDIFRSVILTSLDEAKIEWEGLVWRDVRILEKPTRSMRRPRTEQIAASSNVYSLFPGGDGDTADSATRSEAGNRGDDTHLSLAPDVARSLIPRVECRSDRPEKKLTHNQAKDLDLVKEMVALKETSDEPFESAAKRLLHKARGYGGKTKDTSIIRRLRRTAERHGLIDRATPDIADKSDSQ